MTGQPRRAERLRETREATALRVSLDLDGSGEARIGTGVGGLYDHLLSSLAHHSLIHLEIEAQGRTWSGRAPPSVKDVA